MQIYEIDPLTDPRWTEFLRSHPLASIFHTPDWLGALQQTYRYEPTVFTTSPPANVLTNGIAFCRVTSWLSGRRLVSLPFTDHCAPLVRSPEELTDLLTHVKVKAEADEWKYVEIRPTVMTRGGFDGYRVCKSFLLHKLDLRRTVDEIFGAFHKDCVQRKIKAASKTGLVCEEGRSESLVDKFYRLLITTRRRHGVPVQPRAWFQNLIMFMGDRLKIQVASKDGQPVASIMTLRFKETAIYKYGCSDPGVSKVGATQLLLWKAIQEAKQESGTEFDMGRSDLDNPGLITFKDRWGAVRTPLAYYRCPARQRDSSVARWQGAVSKYIWSHAPESVLVAAGRSLYRHAG